MEFKGKTPPPMTKAAKKAVGRKKKTGKTGGNAAHWAVPYDPVLVPMGSKTLEKILAWRLHEGKEELLIKFKVKSKEKQDFLACIWLRMLAVAEGINANTHPSLDTSLWKL